MKVFIKYDLETLEVKGFFLEDELEEGSNYIEIDKTIEQELLKKADDEMGSLYVKDVELKTFETKQLELPKRETSEQKINALKDENSKLKNEIDNVSKEKDEEILKLKLAIAEIVEGGMY